MTPAKRWELEALRLQLYAGEGVDEMLRGGWSSDNREMGPQGVPRVGEPAYSAFKALGLPPVPHTGRMLRNALDRLAKQKRTK